MSKVAQMPTLKKLDDLFEMSEINSSNDNKNNIDENMRFGKSIRNVISVAIELPLPYPNHPFSLYEGERLNDMVESIKQYGVMTPVILHWKNKKLETLAGHNRIQASKIAGLQEIPATILYNLSDEDALAIVIESNFNQRSFSDMCHSERATVIALQYSSLYAQGKRNDILCLLKSFEDGEKTTSSRDETKLRSDEKVGEMYGLSRSSVARYLRVNKLVTALKHQLDAGLYSLDTAVEVSFLKESEQRAVSNCIALNQFKLDKKKTAALRRCSAENKWDEDTVYLILSGESLKSKGSKANRTPKLKRTTYTKYFTPEQSDAKVQHIIRAALAMYFNEENK